MPDPSEPPQDWVEPELVELAGTIYLNEDFFPYPMYGGMKGNVDDGDDPIVGDGWMPPPFETELKLVTEEGDEWQLLGPEAWVLAVLMWKAEVLETTGTVTGYELEAIPIFYGETDEGNALRRKRGGPVAGDNTLLVLEWEADGIEDPRPKLVDFRPVLEGYTSKVEEYDEYVVQGEDGFDDMLADAGIVLPDPPEPGDDPAVWRGGAENGWSDDPFPPDFVPDYYWSPWEIDWDTETVLGLFLGEMPTAGYMVFVNQIVREDDGIHVQYCVMEPDPWMPVIQVLTYPFCIVAVPKTDEDVIFEEVDAPTYYWDAPMPGPLAGRK